jgi:hypothetical protein
MVAFRILYFWDGLLEDIELLETTDLIAAVRHASHRSSHHRAEVWSGNERLAVVRPSAVIRHEIPAV